MTFADSLVVSQKQSATYCEEDSTINKKAREAKLLMISSSSRKTCSVRKEDSSYSEDDVNDGEDDASVTDLTACGSGVDPHPHHKPRGDSSRDAGGRDKEQHDSLSQKKGSDANRYVEQRRCDRSGGCCEGGRGESSRRRKLSGRRYEEEENYDRDYNEEGSVFSYSRSASGNDHRARRSQKHSHYSFHCHNSTDGVNLKTVLLCMMGTVIIMKLNKPPSPYLIYGTANHEPYSAEINPGVRGTVTNANESFEENAIEGDAELGEDEKAASNQGEEDQASIQYIEGDAELMEDGKASSNRGERGQASIQQPSPPPLPQQEQPMVQQDGTIDPVNQVAFDPQQTQQAQKQQQGFAPQRANQQVQAQQGYTPQQQDQQISQGYYVAQQPQQEPVPNQYANASFQPNSGYAVGQQSTYSQAPLSWQQQQMATLQGQPQTHFGSATDASQMLRPQTFAGGVAPQLLQQPLPEASSEDFQQQQAALISQTSPEAQEAGQTSIELPLFPPPAPSSLLGLLSNFKNTWDPYEKTDIPMFWHIPKAGGSSIKDAMGGCHRFVQATEFGVTDGHIDDTEVTIVYPAVPGVADTDRSPFVNIDSTTVAGIQRAKSMGFADAQLADVVVSPFVFETNDLFTPTAQGRLFSVFRHPIDRAVSMFYYIRVADWEPSYKPELKNWTLEQYATSDVVENNWMTRQLSNQLGGELTEENLKLAMEIVQTKFLVGLMTQIEPTMARCEKFFRWTYHVNPPNQEACRERLMSGGSNSNKKNKKPLEEGDPAWDLLAQQNSFDLKLYAYIEKLFEEQEVFVTGLPDNFRNVDGTCCKCYPPTYPPEGFTCPEAVKNEG